MPRILRTADSTKADLAEAITWLRAKQQAAEDAGYRELLGVEIDELLGEWAAAR